MRSELILIFLILIMRLNVGQEITADYSYDDYEEIPEAPALSPVATTTTGKSLLLDDNNIDDEASRQAENDVIKSQLDAMSNVFRKVITKIKMKFKRIDMVFLVDSSSSVGKENFENEISFVKRLLSDFNVSFNYTRVALITFSSRSKIQIHINQISQVSESNDKCVLLNHQIPNITYSGGGTNTYGALLKAKDIFTNSKRKHSKKILILITDGFSNGRNPKGIAEDLKTSNITIFTVGISSGNLDELKAISSKPTENFNYMLSSFSLFESLARKALHTDYKVGVILPVSNHSLCDSLCDKNSTSTESCCDDNSQCACGYHSGHYNCICNPGYYGTGVKDSGGCEVCPNGTYWNTWNSCFNCPDINHETRKVPAMNILECVCKSGFRETQNNRCEVIKCPLLPVPENGYFVSSTCANTMNSACGARCKSGYQLIGSSIRLCQEDGTWGGQETVCQLKSCPSLLIPFYGATICKHQDSNLAIDYSPRNETFMRDYSPDVQKSTEEFPIDTECVFSCGLGFHLIGSKKRHCLPVGKWDGLQASCKQILCPMLPKIPFGTYDNDECFEQKSPVSTNCSVICDEGFEIKGPAVKTCSTSNNRNGVWSQKNKNPRCVDVTPPTIVCPDDYLIELSNKSYVLLTSFKELKVMEDNSNGNVTFWVKPALKDEGTKMYAGNYTFTYVAIDEVKNKAKCNFTISIADTTPPIFENCIANQTFYVVNATSESIEWEEPHIYDNVDDKNITIIKSMNSSAFLPFGEHLVNYTATDRSGNTNSCLINLHVKEKKCDELDKPENGQRVCVKNDTMTWCDFRCNFGYGLMDNDTVIENLLLTCDLETRIWSIETVPECMAIEQPNTVEEVLTISLNSENLLCEDYAKNQEELIKELKEDLCGDQECDLITELPECIENPGPPDDSASYTIISKRETASKPIKKQKNPEKFELYVKISKNLGMWRSSSTKSENVKRVKEELKKVNSSERFRKRLRNMNLDLTALKLDESITCNPGSVPKKLVCVQCTKGTFHDLSQNICIPCPLGFYNNETGQTACSSCPEYHSTKKTGSRQESDCRQMCGPGTIARIKIPKKNISSINRKTLMPLCRSCGIGEYQPSYDQTTCEKCPEGMTSERASTSMNDCYVRFEDSCNSTTCGEHGQCIQADSFYSCECDDGFYGQNCEISENPCSSAPCFNDGICKVVNETFAVCECPPEYQGLFCEFIDEPCNQKNCQNGANCYEINDEAFCDCLPGYQGDLCETKVQIDFCASSPCLENATCVNRNDYYECICEDGTMGKRCHLQPCDYNPCPVNSVCQNIKSSKVTKDSYSCKCFAGLAGPKCDQVDNPCLPNPCHNEARCTPEMLRDPKNVTAVEDEAIYGKFKCSCPPYFYGDRCEIFTTPDFVFEFEKSSINNYIKFDGPKEDLSAISFCSWIQTNDQFNYGSIISYANSQHDNAFTFTDYNGFVLYINGVNVITDIKIIDNIWHFLCVSWTMHQGFYEIYLDGNLHSQGSNLSQASPIAGNGIFIIGQEQDSVGGSFSETESFVGKISYLDFWKRQLLPTEVNEYYRSCDPYQSDFISWTDLKFKTHGNVKVDKSDFCKPCEKNLEVENAQVIYGDQSAFVRCSDGFNIEGSPMVFCLRTSKWDFSNLPSCKVVKCEALKTPANGRMLMTKLSYKGTAKFKCDDGFKLEGKSTLTCEGNGKWSEEIPTCKSIHECPALMEPKNGKLIYATDSGIISENLESYPLETFVEIKCDYGFETENDNLLTCTENGDWDFEIEDCVAVKLTTTTSTTEAFVSTTSSTKVIEATTEVSSTIKEATTMPVPVKVPKEFWKDLKEFLFQSCVNHLPKLCSTYGSTDFNSDLSTFELPETKEFEGMDLKLYNLLKKLPERTDLTAVNFLKTLLGDTITDKPKADSFRFVLCLYIDLILLDQELGITDDESNENVNINTKIKRLLKKDIKIVYVNYLRGQSDQ